MEIQSVMLVFSTQPCELVLFETIFCRTLKVVGNEKVGGVRNVSFCPNLARTVAIEVRFSLNFAVVFDFIYFRFRPSNAKWLGIVLLNRQNTEKRVQEICWRIKDWYIDATMPLAPLGKAQQYCSVFNFQLVFCRFFSTVNRSLPRNADWLGASIGNAQYEGGKKT